MIDSWDPTFSNLKWEKNITYIGVYLFWPLNFFVDADKDYIKLIGQIGQK